MSQDRFAPLVRRSQDGDQDALEALLLLAHSQVSYLCRILLLEDAAADRLTREILTCIHTRLDSLPSPARFEAWMNRQIAQQCMEILVKPHGTLPPPPTKPPLGVPLSDAETALVFQDIVAALADEPRVCMVLYCFGIDIPTIARIAALSETAVEIHLTQAQDAIRRKFIAMAHQGVEFPVLPPLPQLFRLAMEQSQDAPAAQAMVDSILGKQAPAPAVPRRSPLVPILITAAAFILLIAAFLLLRPRVSPPAETQMPTEVSAPEVSTSETEAPAPAEASHLPAKADMASAGPDGHTHNFRIAGNEAFSCESGGTAILECTVCGVQCTDTLAPGGEHQLELIGGVYDREPSCTESGQITVFCTKCFHFYPQEDPSRPALGHDMEETVNPPTDTEQGYTLHYCNRCGYSYSDDFVAPLPPETEATEANG